MRDYKTSKRRRAKKNRSREEKDYQRVIFGFFRLLLWTSIIIGSFLLLAGGYRYLITAPYFSLEKIAVRGQKRLSPEEVIKASRLKLNDNIFVVDLAQVKKRLEAHPWIEKASVQRLLPRSVRIKIEEKEPVALIHLENLYYLDKNGQVFKKISPEDSLNYPVITGIARRDLSYPGGQDLQDSIGSALTLLKLSSGGGWPRKSNISEINVDPDLGLSIFTVETASQIKLGFDQISRKWSHLQMLLPLIQGRLRNIKYIDLNYRKMAVVKTE
ncbi:MAG: FtsQ-type POTRA domain-containing protein [Deltaproteobacteria bacterium]|nr:MAG: FtsQ-type POTRA domain-containing protein [Deltaproteobacteria bacterium]